VLDGYRGVDAAGTDFVESGGHPELKQLAEAVKSPESLWKKKLNAERTRNGADELPRRLRMFASLPGRVRWP
jgi:hypothetical protein